MHDFVTRIIPPDIIGLDELSQILVRTEYGDGIPFFAQVSCQCANNVIGFITVAGEVCDTGGAAKVAAGFELAFELLRCGWAVGFIFGVDLPAVGVGLFGIKCAGDILGLFQFYELAQKFGEAVDGIGRVAVGISHFVGVAVPATENIDAGVDQVGAFFLIIGHRWHSTWLVLNVTALGARSQKAV
jgi:hypothetical protein